MNADLQKKVMDAIQWEPSFYGDEINITVKDGIVTLAGTVSSFAKKEAAKNTVKDVSGVQSVLEQLEVSSNREKDNDYEIERAIASAYKGHYEIPDDCLKVKVEAGWVTIDGIVEWNHQKEAAKKIVSNFIGVKGVIDHIIIKPKVTDAIEKHEIKKALLRCGYINETNIDIAVSGNTVTLKGSTDTLYEKSQAERVAWKVPGVTKIINDILVTTTRENS